MFQSVFSMLCGFTPLTLTTCAPTGVVLHATEKPRKKHNHAYLPIQFSQLLLNKRSIQKVLLTCRMTGLTQHTLAILKKNPNQFR